MPKAPARPDTVHDEHGAKMPVHKPEYWDMCEICKRVYARNQHITSFHETLVNFGYTSLTRLETAAAYDKAIAGPVSAEDGIIAKLIRSQLEEAGLVA